jgi:phospholipid-binding lipoprotein MlaA
MEARRMKTTAALTAAILAAGLAFAPLPASAASAAAAPQVAVIPAAVVPAAAAPSPADSYDGGVLDTYSRALFWFNRQVYDGLNAVADALAGGAPAAPVGETGLSGPARTAIGRGVGNMASNLVNEPVTALASAVSGDFAGAANAVGRFGVNTTVGLLGWNDVAADWGMEPKITDIGLVMCQAGVGEGGYVVLPFIGPRTVRDAVADVVLVNAILWTAVGASLGTGASWRTIAIAETVEIVADIIATRQIDPNAKVVHFDDYEAVRKAYLEQRRIRCASSGKG